MAKKEFTYRGMTMEKLQGLSREEFAQLIPSRERRSVLRGLTNEQKNLLRKIQNRDNVKTHARDMVVFPEMVGKKVRVHLGSGYTQVEITSEMLGSRLGQFVLTRKPAKHASPGVTGKKTKVSVK